MKDERENKKKDGEKKIYKVGANVICLYFLGLIDVNTIIQYTK